MISREVADIIRRREMVAQAHAVLAALAAEEDADADLLAETIERLALDRDDEDPRAAALRATLDEPAHADRRNDEARDAR